MTTPSDIGQQGDTRSRPELGYVSRFVPGYRRAVIRAFARRLEHGLVVASGQPPAGSSLNKLIAPDDDDHFISHLELKNHWLGGDRIHWQQAAALFGPQGPTRVLLIEESPRTVSLKPLLWRAKRRGLKTILWGHFSSIDRPLGGSNWRDNQRLKTARQADALLTYTDEHRDILADLTPGTPVFSARNTLDTSVLFPVGDALLKENRTVIRSRLGLSDGPTLLFLGRLIPEKGPVRVVETASALKQRTGQSVSAVFVGDGPEREAIEACAATHQVPVTFTGTMTDLSESSPWIAACDALVNPGYLGLSVNHALSLGVPVVAPSPAPDGSGHSPEWVFVKDGLNGRFADSSASEDMVHATADILKDVVGYRERSARYAREELSLDRMVEGMLDAVRHVAPNLALRPVLTS